MKNYLLEWKNFQSIFYNDDIMISNSKKFFKTTHQRGGGCLEDPISNELPISQPIMLIHAYSSNFDIFFLSS